MGHQGVGPPEHDRVVVSDGAATSRRPQDAGASDVLRALGSIRRVRSSDFASKGWNEVVAFYADRVMGLYRKPPIVGRAFSSDVRGRSMQHCHGGSAKECAVRR